MCVCISTIFMYKQFENDSWCLEDRAGNRPILAEIASTMLAFPHIIVYYAYIHKYIYIYTHTYLSIYLFIYLSIYIHFFIYISIHVYTYIYIYMYRCIHIYIYMWMYNFYQYIYTVPKRLVVSGRPSRQSADSG